jgi:hypothetical protein
VVGGAAAFGAMAKNQVDATTSYAKVAIEEAPIASPKASFTFTPEPPPQAAAAEAAPSARRGGGARSGGTKPAGGAATPPAGPRIRLGGGIKTR